MSPKKPKTAIVLIHGMGEQRPMDTLWEFVDAVWSTDADLVEPFNGQVYAKPDTANDSFELRRVTTRYWKHAPGRRVDFFEFYWAHLMRGNTVQGTVGWVAQLLFRKPSSVPAELRPLWMFGTLLFLLAALLLFAASLDFRLLTSWLGVLPAFALGLVSLVGGLVASWWLAPVAGDAARYFSPDPENVEARQKIMRAGVALIERLTTSGEYDRIVVVGHSLGTAIGYDIVHQAFGRVVDWEKAHGNAETANALAILEKSAGDLLEHPDEPRTTKFRDAQRDYAARLRSGWSEGKAPWLVSDLVTLGSPLSKADILIARDRQRFEQLIDRRQVASCPPRLERKRPPSFSYARDQGPPVPHFGSVFGPTCWTNLFYPHRFLILGDVISGPLQPLYGPGVRDVRVGDAGLRFRHGDYWRTPRAVPTPIWIEAVRRAVNIKGLKDSEMAPSDPLPEHGKD